MSTVASPTKFHVDISMFDDGTFAIDQRHPVPGQRNYVSRKSIVMPGNTPPAFFKEAVEHLLRNEFTDAWWNDFWARCNAALSAGGAAS
ncbi:MAG TPA: hypothetical protein VGP68_14575 [Gemmataceae bacterium]|jgi:hypothetical protein|nr:hypothetical protein [Gemmataceae bacterium]